MNKVAMGLALALAASAFAGHPQTINKEGFVGVNKTQSAQSLGHSKLVFTLLGDATFGNDMFPNDESGPALHEATYNAEGNLLSDKNAPVADFVGGSAYIMISSTLRMWVARVPFPIPRLAMWVTSR